MDTHHFNLVVETAGISGVVEDSAVVVFESLFHGEQR